VIDGELVTNLCGSNNAGTSGTVDCSVKTTDANNSSWYFNGKVGIYPGGEEMLARQNLVNRTKGTSLLQTVLMTKKVLPILS
jgi:hypothetical protein